MTFNVGHIAGGTHSRCRTVKQAHKEWMCRCHYVFRTGSIKTHPGWRNKCDLCGDKRPT